jgi:glutamate/tyrosine decarboxylase-like PLP-dependent enzyme
MTQDIEPLLIDVARRAAHYLAGLGERQVAPSALAVADLPALGGALPEAPTDPQEVLRLLDTYGSPATVANAGPRYFGFVTGGSPPATVAAAIMVAAWDQNAALEIMSPVAAALEATAGRWIVELLGLPDAAAVGFTTGATMANLTGLAAARQAVLARTGWNLAEQGLAGSPPISVVVGDEVHVSVLKALNLLGIGRAQLVRVPADDQGRMRPEAFPSALHAPTIVCLQAGNVNTGAIDPLRELCDRAHALGAWVHIDGAFGLWARVSPLFVPIADGAEQADSWATDAHKWLNVPYDCGVVIVRDSLALRAAMAASAAYLAERKGHDGAAFVPDFSRRARGVGGMGSATPARMQRHR